MRRLLRYSLRGLLILTTVVALLLGWRMSTVRVCEKALNRLDEARVYYDLEEPSAASLWDRIPSFRVRRVAVLKFHSFDLRQAEPVAEAVEILARHSQVREVDLGVRGYGPTRERDLPGLLALLTPLKSVRTLRINGPVYSVESVQSITEFPRLEEFGSHGSSGWCQKDALRFVVSIPSVKRIGLPQGQFEVPSDILGQRPDIEYFQTDFPP